MAGQTITISVLADTKKFSAAMQGLGDETGFNKLAAGAAKVGKAAAIGVAAVGAAAIAWGADTAQSLLRIEQLGAATENVIRGTGGAAGRTREQVDNLAGSIEKMTGVEGEAITEGQNMLLTFTNIKGTSFDRATQTMTDMAVALNKGSLEGVDMAATSVQLGKALNDPVKGISALSKVGVSFTEDQKAMIESMAAAGDMAGAQGVIMDELAKEFGGAAEAAGGTPLGKWAKVKNMFGEISERVFAFLVPAMEKISSWLLDKGVPLMDKFGTFIETTVLPALSRFGTWIKEEGIPKLKEWGLWIKENIIPILASLGGWLKDDLIPSLISFGAWIVKNQDWLKAIAVVVGTVVLGIQAYVKVMAIWRAAMAVGVAVQTLFNAVMLANPIGLIVLAVAALVAGLVYFFTQTETGSAIFMAAWGGIEAAIHAIADWWSNTFVPALAAGWEAIVSFFLSGKDQVIGFLQGLWDFIKTVWSYSPIGFIVTNWEAIIAFFTAIPGRVKALFDQAIEFIKTIWSYSPLGAITANWDSIIAWLTGIPQKVKDVFAGASSWLQSAGADIMRGLWNGIESLATWVTDKAKDIGSGIIDGFKGMLGINSPSRVFEQLGVFTVQGLDNGLSKIAGLKSTMGSLSATVSNGFDPDLSMDISGSKVPSGGDTYNVTLQTLVPTAESGRVIAQSLKDFKRSGGQVQL